MVLCVYAIARRPRRPIRTRGLRGERLSVAGAGSLVAIVGQGARAPSPTLANLRRFDRVLSALSTELPALLPARFGTSVESLDEITFILQSRAEGLRAALRTVRGRVQMTVRLADTDAPPRSSAAATTRASGAAYLRARAAAAARERHVPGFDPVRSAVASFVREERVERRAGMVAVYHLVPAGSVDRYLRALARSAEEAGVRVRVSGPFAPYAFSGW
jgi:hypothetical protein